MAIANFPPLSVPHPRLDHDADYPSGEHLRRVYFPYTEVWRTGTLSAEVSRFASPPGQPPKKQALHPVNPLGPSRQVEKGGSCCRRRHRRGDGDAKQGGANHPLPSASVSAGRGSQTPQGHAGRKASSHLRGDRWPRRTLRWRAAAVPPLAPKGSAPVPSPVCQGLLWAAASFMHSSSFTGVMVAEERDGKRGGRNEGGRAAATRMWPSPLAARLYGAGEKPSSKAPLPSPTAPPGKAALKRQRPVPRRCPPCSLHGVTPGQEGAEASGRALRRAPVAG
ncbi:uncharacterized protein LOC128324251 isoform X2 [Hemicordylus capensis]|uniref:uncharacterized protein LOC128324251 isoform X2 n=1 Tax=Hemicordylus capensis TaxID=884348 RepID=UPI00230428C2|nr:uncharacterized protein LOC128324251 isoform X2 [Hemicordylus capensis]